MPQKMVILTMVNRWWRGDDNKKYDNDVVQEQEDNRVPGSGDGESGGDACETKVVTEIIIISGFRFEICSSAELAYVVIIVPLLSRFQCWQ